MCVDQFHVSFSFHSDSLPTGELFLVGSWNDQGQFDPNWTGRPRAMVKKNDGEYALTIELSGEAGETFHWGVKDSKGVWMFFEHSAEAFELENGNQRFFLGFRDRLGLHRDGGDGFRTALWAPNAVSVDLEVFGEHKVERWSLTQFGEYWETKQSSSWKNILGLPYGFRLKTSCGQSILRCDPYALQRQGPQRGVVDLFLSPEGEYSHRYEEIDNLGHHLRFEAVGRDSSSEPVLKLYDATTNVALSLEALRERFVEIPELPETETWGMSRVQADGSIPLVKHPSLNVSSVCLGPERALRGLRYEICGEDGEFYHDLWDQCLDGHHNWPRLGIVAETQRTRRQRKDEVGTKNTDLVIYELHIGSLLGEGGNLKTSTYEEILPKLKLIAGLGFNTLALMPTNATESWRDWGYFGTSSFAHQSAYSATGGPGDVSLISFVEEAHRLGLKVLCDVVYNHVGGFHNDFWEFDGLENSWFEWEAQSVALTGTLPERPFATTEAKPRTKKPSVRNTPWGPIPAFCKRAVHQFYVDHAMDQIERLGFDGIRFDFTHLIHSEGGGGAKGWNLLRAIHLRLAYFFPEALTFAEEFPPNPVLTNSVLEGGAGFTGMWNTEHQHRLIFDNHRSSVTQSMVEGGRPDLGRVLQQITFPEGFSSPASSATVLSNHDEVGNAQRLYQLVKTHRRGFDMARLVSCFSLLSPGFPIVFQGTEDLASNYFSWGLPHTWDTQSHLLGKKLPSYREQQLLCIRDVLHLRKEFSDLWAGSLIQDSFLDEEHHVLAIRRGGFWVVGNFGSEKYSLELESLSRGRLLFSTEKSRFGYLGERTRGLRVGSYALKVWAVD